MVGLIFAGVAKNLSDGAAAAKYATADILASITVFFGDRILRAHVLPCFHKGIDSPYRKGKRTNKFRESDKDRSVYAIWRARNFKSCGINNVGGSYGHHHPESVPGGETGTGHAEPGEVHSLHYLAHCNLSAQKRAAEMRMHAAKATKVEETVLPTPRRGLDAGLTGPVGRDGCEEAVTLLDTSRGDRRGKSLLRIFVHLSVESVSLGKVRGCHHVDHQRRFIQGGLEIVRRHLARIISGLPQEEATRF